MTWPGDDPNDLAWNSTYSAVAARVIGLPLTLLGSALFFPPTEKTFELSWATVGFLTLIGIFNAGGALSYRYSMYVTSSLSVQRIIFFTPVLQMLWIWLFAEVSIANPVALLIGTGYRAPLQPGVPDRIRVTRPPRPETTTPVMAEPFGTGSQVSAVSS